MFRPRRPLMRAAMVGGAGYMVGKNAAKSRARESDQEARLSELEAEQQQAPAAAPAPAAPAAAASGGTDVVSKLKELKELLDAGVLDQGEFEAAKQKVLQGS